jgi:hypothetical protein
LPRMRNAGDLAGGKDTGASEARIQDHEPPTGIIAQAKRLLRIAITDRNIACDWKTISPDEPRVWARPAEASYGVEAEGVMPPHRPQRKGRVRPAV